MAASIYSKGTKVWFEDREQGWIRGEVQSIDIQADGPVNIVFINERQKEIALKTTLKDIANSAKNLPPLCNTKEYEQVDDLSHLPHLNEPSLLQVILNRYSQQQLYTYSGIVLVAVNPFTDVPIYGHDIIQTYAGRKRDELRPHLFTIAEEAYGAMQSGAQNQTIIVSGESGAGKTESAKYIMRYMASVKSNTVHDSVTSTSVEHQVLATNPILEAFGNAKTSRNDNSSRFGKYIQILFDDQSSIVGARIRTYLLERSRISFQQRSERNYHIFYQLCEGVSSEERATFGLDSDASGYRYLSSSSIKIDNVNDATNFSATRQALSIVGIDEEKQLAIFRLLAGILHLGNVEIAHRRDAKDSIIDDQNDAALQKAMELLGVDPVEFAKCTTKKLIDARGETFSSARTMDQAIGVRDGVAKFIYASIFDWLVLRINESLSADEAVQREQSFIAVLDIYGFEHFQTNSFEQFCINYANEKLQQQFISHVFKLEQAEYAQEAIDWTTIEFSDNQSCIDLIEGKLGIIALLDEESRLATGTDESLIDKLNSQLKTPEHKAVFKDHLHGNEAFLVAHYAGDVSYNIDGFLEKNRGTVPDEHKTLLTGSSNAFLREVVEVGFNIGTDTHHSHASPGSPTKTTAALPHKLVPPKNPIGPGLKSVSGRKPTQGSIFKSSLLTLTEALQKTEIHYIRCIKPNENKRPWEFDSPLVLSQLRACGVLETIRITSAGYPTRWTFEDFAARYRLLLPSSEKVTSYPDSRQLTEAILKHIVPDKTKYQNGKTKIFFRPRVVAILDGMRNEREYSAAMSIQSIVRGVAGRKRAKALREERAAELARKEAEAEAAAAKAKEEAEAEAAAAKAKEESEVAATHDEAETETEVRKSPPSTPAKQTGPRHSGEKNELANSSVTQAQARAAERARVKTPTRSPRAHTPSSSTGSRYAPNSSPYANRSLAPSASLSGSHFELPHFHPDDSRFNHTERCAACRAKAEARAAASAAHKQRGKDKDMDREGRTTLRVPDVSRRSISVEPVTQGRRSKRDSSLAPMSNGKDALAVPVPTTPSKKSKRSKSIDPGRPPEVVRSRPTTPTTEKFRRFFSPSKKTVVGGSSNPNANRHRHLSHSHTSSTPVAAVPKADPSPPELKIYKQFMEKKPMWVS